MHSGKSSQIRPEVCNPHLLDLVALIVPSKARTAIPEAWTCRGPEMCGFPTGICSCGWHALIRPSEASIFRHQVEVRAPVRMPVRVGRRTLWAHPLGGAVRGERHLGSGPRLRCRPGSKTLKCLRGLAHELLLGLLHAVHQLHEVVEEDVVGVAGGNSSRKFVASRG